MDNTLFSEHYTQELDFLLDTVAQIQVLTVKESDYQKHWVYILPMKLPNELKSQNI